jgi:serine phosphatase RsbU (regulator of sigma subunit)
VQVQLGAAKVPKYATRESGDTLEIIERPQGGLSAVLVDGQRSGRNAKIISNIVARKAISLLGEGVRDGAAARAAHDYLVTHRSGQVSAELVILSVDLKTRTLVISRNSRCPAHVWREGALIPLDTESQPVGIRDFTKPAICELPISVGTYVVAHTDGLDALARLAGEGSLDAILTAGAHERASAQEIADRLLSAALALEQGRPTDDISVLVLAVLAEAPLDGARRLTASFPFV